MDVFCSVCLVGILFLISLKERWISPIIVYLGLWSLIVLLSCMNLYGIKKPGNEAYLLILLMSVLFSGGYLFGKKVKNQKRIVNQEAEPVLNMFTFKILFIFSLLFAILDTYLVISYFMSGYRMWEIRNWTLQPFGSSNPLLDRRSFIEELFRTIIIEPFKMLIPPIAAYTFFSSKESKTKILVSSLLLLVLSSVSGGGGRLTYLYYVGVLLVAYSMNKKTKTKRTKKLKKRIRSIAIFAIIMVVINTSIRAGFENLLKQVYTYFALPPTLLSIWLPQLEELPNTFGLLTTFGFHSYFFRGLASIGLASLVPQIYNISYDYIVMAEKFLNIGNGIGNAFVTPIYYFYLDGGIMFVILASFIFGIITSISYKKTIRAINLKSFCKYCLIVYGVFISFMRIQTAIPSYIISFILVSILFNNNTRI